MVTADTESFLSFLQVMPGMAATVTRNPVSWSESWGSCFPGPTLFPPENRAADGRLQPLKGDPHQSLVPREVAPREAPPPPGLSGPRGGRGCASCTATFPAVHRVHPDRQQAALAWGSRAFEQAQLGGLTRVSPQPRPGMSAETGTIAGVASALAMALIGAVSSYISYQQKKFCFSIQRKWLCPAAPCGCALPFLSVTPWGQTQARRKREPARKGGLGWTQ